MATLMGTPLTLCQGIVTTETDTHDDDSGKQLFKFLKSL